MSAIRQIALVLLISMIFTAVFASVDFWTGNTSVNIMRMKSGDYNPYREFNEWINSFVFTHNFTTLIMDRIGHEGGYYLLCYLRDLIGGTAVYWISGGLWHIFVYKIFGTKLFDNEKRPYPENEVIYDQMMLAQASVFLYAALPILSEWLVESGYTKVYFFIEEVGWEMYAVYFVAYLTLVEIGIYWMHRTLHTNKVLFTYIHELHHKYKSHQTLTPWASIAFNPFDGILQASPYVACLFLIPMHYFTHVFLLFFSGVWATNIHDAIYADSEPIMGAKYHTIHHTHFNYNYGQFFIFCDWFWGTLKPPKSKLEFNDNARREKRKKQKKP